jgi:hypothetical protein
MDDQTLRIASLDTPRDAKKSRAAFRVGFQAAQVTMEHPKEECSSGMMI